jgi:hypothetical protein
MALRNTPAIYVTELITSIISFMIQAPGISVKTLLSTDASPKAVSDAQSKLL